MRSLSISTFKFAEKETCYLTFINGSLETVDKNLLTLLKNGFKDKCERRKVAIKEVFDVNKYVKPANSRNINCLIWQVLGPKEPFVAFATSQSDGWMTLMNEYAQKYKTKLIRVAFSGEQVESPIFLFEYQFKNISRVIQVNKDSDKWIFFSSGRIMGFENTENYKKHIIKSRLTNEIINEYLTYFQIDVNDYFFWTPKKMATSLIVNFERKN